MMRSLGSVLRRALATGWTTAGPEALGQAQATPAGGTSLHLFLHSFRFAACAQDQGPWRSRPVAQPAASTGDGRRPPSGHPHWEERLQQLEAFTMQHGRLPRGAATQSKPFLEGELQLGRWVAQQRQRWRGKGWPLRPQQVAALESLPLWLWEVQQPWERWLQQVAAFVAQHSRLPRSDAGRGQPFLEGEQRLGNWCKRQRQCQKGQGNSGPLTPEQVAALEALPGWFWEEFRVQPWEQQLQQLTAFLAQHGRRPRVRGGISKPLVEGEAALGWWCQQQRQRHKGLGSCGPLTAGQVSALEALPGWVWEEYQPWERQLQQLAAFVAQHSRLPRTKAGNTHPMLEGEQQLGCWCAQQRRRNKGQGSGGLSPEQVAALEALPGWFWDVRQAQPWEQRLQQVAAFVTQHGRPPRQTAGNSRPLLEGEQRLGKWCSIQRQRFKGKGSGGPLSAEQVAVLEAYAWWRW